MNPNNLKAWWAKIKPQAQGTAIFEPVKQPHPETRRVTKAAILLFSGLVLLIMAGLGFTAYSKAQYQQQRASQPMFKPKASTSEIPDWFAKKQAEGIIAGDDTKPTEPPPAEPETVSGALGAASQSSVEAGTDPMAQVSGSNAEQPFDQERMAQEMQSRTIVTNALQSETTLYHQQKANAIPATLVQKSASDSDNAQELNTPKMEPENYLLHTRTPAVSPQEIKAGTVIPSVLLSGIDSTLPGPLIAQVTQNVYDTATGRSLLIPQGTRLIGSYDHQIAGGQKRVLIVWNRLIYPDASSVALDSMAGVDMAGYSGFQDKTDTHFWPTFRNALMLSAISAGVQLSQPRATNGNAYSSNQVAAGALGQQMNQVGMNTIDRTQNQRPTLQIRSGYRFNVLVNKDMILPPWTPQEASR
jgi:type IV secretory pathway VirB10-like protein